jgi:hypothetical protein
MACVTSAIGFVVRALLFALANPEQCRLLHFPLLPDRTEVSFAGNHDYQGNFAAGTVILPHILIFVRGSGGNPERCTVICS